MRPQLSGNEGGGVLATTAETPTGGHTRPVSSLRRQGVAEMNEALPTGTVTFMFTDIEESTHLWDAHPQRMDEALRRHDELLRRRNRRRRWSRVFAMGVNGSRSGVSERCGRGERGLSTCSGRCSLSGGRTRLSFGCASDSTRAKRSNVTVTTSARP